MSVALGAGATVREILMAALGCNIAWGIVDATVYLLTTATERARGRAQARAIRTAPDPEAKAQLRALLPEQAGRAMSDEQAETILAWMRDNPPERNAGPVLQRPDYWAAVQVFLLVTGATFPPVLPFLLVDSVPLAMRLSNAVAVAMLVVIGWRLDQEMQGGRHLMRWIIPVIGLLMVAVTIALGG
jgi:VIT1/CCC1 family predicted Fe2+/Mn2+ transporter